MTIKRLFAVMLLLLTASPAAYAARVGIAAIVNDEIITTTDVAERRDIVLATNGLPPTMENQQRVTARVLDGLIDETLQLQEARRLSIAVRQEELDAALAQLEESRRLPPGGLAAAFSRQGLSMRSLAAQFNAQLAWNKVVQRKLRREVSIAADEIARAQAAQAADPGVPEVRIAAISILVPSPEQEAAQAAFAGQLMAQLQNGTDLMALAMQLQDREDVRISPPGWIAEEKLQPVMQQALRGLTPGAVSPPLKSMNTYQLVQLLARRTAKPLPDSTEVVVKEIVLPLPAQADPDSLLALRDAARAVAVQPGSCMDTTIGAPVEQARARFVRTTLGDLPPPLRPVISNLAVAQTSEPLMSDEAVRLIMLCEKIEPATGNLPPAAEVRRALFNEKIELEAQKHLRNLRRDAFIDIKGNLAGGDA